MYQQQYYLQAAHPRLLGNRRSSRSRGLLCLSSLIFRFLLSTLIPLFVLLFSTFRLRRCWLFTSHFTYISACVVSITHLIFWSLLTYLHTSMCVHTYMHGDLVLPESSKNTITLSSRLVSRIVYVCVCTIQIKCYSLLLFICFDSC
ncbi:hypothetical protein BDN71DRAFT_249656 [Pleurotus eryngii]|uniref:Uncharacterized protein n=1 Tax=Pleurotus eryngii TaxID=5323 RepID=A0A9P5ZP78_PLEER|nr:hypothetical protein BDN71DRAFT_249656 [Pleurotus eryngii]